MREHTGWTQRRMLSRASIGMLSLSGCVTSDDIVSLFVVRQPTAVRLISLLPLTTHHGVERTVESNSSRKETKKG